MGVKRMMTLEKKKHDIQTNVIVDVIEVPLGNSGIFSVSTIRNIQNLTT